LGLVNFKERSSLINHRRENYRTRALEIINADCRNDFYMTILHASIENNVWAHDINRHVKMI